MLILHCHSNHFIKFHSLIELNVNCASFNLFFNFVAGDNFLSPTGDFDRGAVVVDDDEVLRIGVLDVKETFLELVIGTCVRPEIAVLTFELLVVELVLGIGAVLDKGDGEKISSIPEVSE